MTADAAHHAIHGVAWDECGDARTNFLHGPCHIEAEHGGKRLPGIRSFADANLCIKRIRSAVRNPDKNLGSPRVSCEAALSRETLLRVLPHANLCNPSPAPNQRNARF
jgi:hypothetical protein